MRESCAGILALPSCVGFALTFGRSTRKNASVAGYSSTALSKKLGIKVDSRVAIVSAPAGFVALLDPLPEGVRLLESARGRNDVLVFFATRRNELNRRFSKLANAIDADGGVWIVWPKRTANVATDLTENVVRTIGLEAGLVDNKVCAIDDTWSGLRFVYRLVDRPARR